MSLTKNKMQFVKTDSEETAIKLRTLGFTEITEPESDMYCFMNNGKIIFDATKEDRCIYTNVLFI